MHGPRFFSPRTDITQRLSTTVETLNAGGRDEVRRKTGAEVHALEQDRRGRRTSEEGDTAIHPRNGLSAAPGGTIRVT